MGENGLSPTTKKEIMQIGYIGLGKMGKNMVLRLLEKGHQVVAWNRSEEPKKEVEAQGAITTTTIEELVEKLSGEKKIIWVMLPAGEVTQGVIEKLANLLSSGDIIIDGGNSFYKDSIKHHELLKQNGIQFIDVGISGGPSGARNGACIMVGGNQELYQELEPLFKDTAAENAYQHFEGVGAGHFVKMIHNGIEYGMMQSIAEGFSVMKKSNYDLNLQKVAKIYNNKSVIESRLIGWLENAFKNHGSELNEISGSIKNSGEGKWTVETAKEAQVPTPVIEASYQFRINSSENPSYTGKIVSALRNQFGGHEVSEKN